jgi:hypothetical protein
MNNNFFPESAFRLTKHYTTYIISGDYLSKAINSHDNSKEEVNVIKWFADFWLYVEIRFQKTENSDFSIFFSLSVFQGEQTDSIKYQLFRAEWDNFDNNDLHPQPHWHFYSEPWMTESFNEILTITKESYNFLDMINEKKSKYIDLKRVHFAMNGQWSTMGSHCHRIKDEDTIRNWLQGLLGHIKSQLEYVK